ncbi:MAG: c-type cytochrome, partial [Planctomycetales bacterium]|nr:c-type cytochrome [Planctomycetales bacterium]
MSQVNRKYRRSDQPWSLRSVLKLLAVAVAIAGLTKWPAWAQGPRDLKPLPSFLRSAKVADRYLGTRDISEVMQFERTEPVCLQLVKRPGVEQHVREEALRKLAELRKTDAVAELLPWLSQADSSSSTATTTSDKAESALADLAELLTQQQAESLAQHRDELLKLAFDGQQDVTRQAAFAAILAADHGIETVWSAIDAHAAADQRRLDLVRGLRWLANDVPRNAVETKLKPLLVGQSTAELQEASLEVIGSLTTLPKDTFDLLAASINNDKFVDACVSSICNLPNEAWTPASRRGLATNLVGYLGQKPLAERTLPAAKQATKLIRSLADLLPAGEANEIRRQLESVTIRELTVHTVEEKMAYDQTVIVVQAGQGVQIKFINEDIMPHNLVIVDSPAAREEVGIAADRMQTQADALAKGYLPDSPHILHASRLIQPKDTDTLTFSAPAEPGTYAYLCTFPGHWSKMYGALVVTDDAAAYLATHQPLPSADELLGIRTVDWTWEQLTEQLAGLSEGRSFENGQKNFLRASCFSCHQIKAEGGRIGPDLTKIREKYKTPEELLRQIVFPSEKVEEQYATVIIETTNGNVLRGVVVSETETELRINENPLAS